MANENGILAALNGLFDGLNKGMETREKRQSEEAKLAVEARKAEQDMQIQAANLLLKQADSQSKAKYFERMADLKERNTKATEYVAYGKGEKERRDTDKGYISEIKDIDKQIRETEKELADARDNTSQKRRDERDGSDLYNQRVKALEDNLKSFKENRVNAETRLKPLSRKQQKDRSQKLQKIMMLESRDEITPDVLAEADSLNGDEREEAKSRLKELLR